MRLTRVFLDVALAPGATVALSEQTASHLVRVLRLREGDTCVLFNGDGRDHRARIVESGKRRTVVEVLGAEPVENESPLRIVLLQGIARGEKMDLILQKATELGVARIVPVESERSEVRLDGARLARRIEHWRAVVVAACEQCGRARLPEIEAPVAIGAIGGIAHPAGLRLTLDPQGEHALPALASRMPADGGVAIAIGPEGGWAPRDREQLRAAGYEGLRLGPRILRTETAGLAAIAALQAMYGDLHV